MSKYKARKVTIDGITFDSQKEANRYFELRLLERSGAIVDLQRQVRFVLIPAQKDANGKVIERAVNYIADFVYYHNGGRVVEDAKGYRTPEYRLKKKMMLYFHSIKIKEV